MSTKGTLKYEHNDNGWFHLYREVFDGENQFVYLELGGVPFETATSISLSTDGPSRVAVRIPEE
jgi:hypothetical protein